MRETSKVSAGPLSPKIYGDRDVLRCISARGCMALGMSCLVVSAV